MNSIEFDVIGEPAPKGSYNAVTNRRTGKTAFIPNNTREMPWRQNVEHAAMKAWHDRTGAPTMPRLDGPLTFNAVFYLTRPKTVKRILPTAKNDLDKIIRSTWDALTQSGLIADDGRIWQIGHASKRYVDSQHKHGAHITIQWDRPQDHEKERQP